jgi:hypothetical protein
MICSALTHRRRLRPAGYGDERIPCAATRGLRSLVDRDGITRLYCATAGHIEDVVRRFGLADPPEPEWAMPEPMIPQEAWDQAVDTTGLRRVGPDARPCVKCGYPEYPSHHDPKMPQWEDHPYEAAEAERRVAPETESELAYWR